MTQTILVQENQQKENQHLLMKIKEKNHLQQKYLLLMTKNNSIDEQLNQQREKQLELLNEKFTKLYNSKDKIYENIIKEIDVEKNLVYKGSLMSFNLLILKIRCLMKLLKEKLEYVLKSKDQKNYYEVDLYIQKVKNEFKKIYLILNEDDKYEYEILTQNLQ